MYRKILLSILVVALVSHGMAYYMIGIGSGSSMKPVIDSCDILVIDKTQDTVSEVERGDIIAYQTVSGRMVAHKYANIALGGSEPSIVAKGVNNQSPDPVVIENSNLIGEVSQIIENPFC